ncbi:MAG: hypothetical protein ABIA04_15560 [Pseudomonadota bacterium]
MLNFNKNIHVLILFILLVPTISISSPWDIKLLTAKYKAAYVVADVEMSKLLPILEERGLKAIKYEHSKDGHHPVILTFGYMYETFLFVPNTEFSIDWILDDYFEFIMVIPNVMPKDESLVLKADKGPFNFDPILFPTSIRAKLVGDFFKFNKVLGEISSDWTTYHVVEKESAEDILQATFTINDLGDSYEMLKSLELIEPLFEETIMSFQDDEIDDSTCSRVQWGFEEASLRPAKVEVEFLSDQIPGFKKGEIINVNEVDGTTFGGFFGTIDLELTIPYDCMTWCENDLKL